MSDIELKGKRSVTAVVGDTEYESDHLLVEARCENTQRRSARRGNADWSIVVTWGAQTVEVGLATDTEWADTESERQQIRLVAIIDGEETDIATIDKNVAKGRGYNSLVTEVGEGIMRLWIGEHVPEECGTIAVPYGMPDRVELHANRKINVEYFLVETLENPASRLTTEWTGRGEEELQRYLDHSTDRHEGIWRYLDRDVDAGVARPGGEYRLATVSDGEGGYVILYLSGAQVNGEKWKSGMIKGRLRPTIFVDHYDLEWMDAMMEKVSEDASGEINLSLGILTVTMPLEKATLRYSREQLQGIR
ncbi:MAG: hypothetical protein K2M04_06255 [Muribaculaceae bacterium]|nr:hypothetical protein [Muribaculaceae bacterium]